jgi:hypothetical protein
MKFSIDKRERFCVLKIDEEKLLSNFAPLLKSELVMLHTEGFKNIILESGASCSLSIHRA